MKYLLPSLIAFLCFPLSAPFAQIADIDGLWLASKKKDVAIAITRCENTLCGHIAWTDKETQAEHPHLCGISVLSDFKQSKKTPQKWIQGTIYRASKDQYFGATAHQLSDDTIELRAYVALPALGKTIEFERVTQTQYPPCKAQ